MEFKCPLLNNNAMDPFSAYIICTSPRSGSTLLCKLLQNIEIAGFPESHFHNPSLSDWLEYCGLSGYQFAERSDALKAVFSKAYEIGKGNSDIFGLRLQRHSFDFFVEQLGLIQPSDSGDRSAIEAVFGKTLYIHLTRENKIDQAISYVKATQSGLWHMAPDGCDIERRFEYREPVYDPEAIATQLALSLEMDRQWDAWFEAQEIEPLIIDYDVLCADPKTALAGVLKALGVQRHILTETAIPVAKLADKMNQEWADRFRRDCPDVEF